MRYLAREIMDIIDEVVRTRNWRASNDYIQLIKHNTETNEYTFYIYQSEIYKSETTIEPLRKRLGLTYNTKALRALQAVYMMEWITQAIEKRYSKTTVSNRATLLFEFYYKDVFIKWFRIELD